LYFYKQSIDKYPSEFWSEIIASKVGRELNFEIVDYNVAKHKHTIGCLCESMIDQQTQELDHGISIIKNAIPGFVVTERPEISFQQIEKALQNYRDYILNFIHIMVFDAIIGNQDRHSENWAIIRSLDIENKEFNSQRLLKFFKEMYQKSGLQLKHMPFKDFFLKNMDQLSLVDYKFSPIYDSGSSLGREINDNSIDDYLSNNQKITKYIQNGKSEVRWHDKQVKHFELLAHIKSAYPAQLEIIAQKAISSFNAEKIRTIIFNIDQNLPTELNESSLSLQRKELIARFIEQRIQKLKELVREN